MGGGGAGEGTKYGISIAVIPISALIGERQRAVFRALSRIHIFYAARDVEYELRNDFYRHLTTLDPEFYAQNTTGDLMSRATHDLGQVRLVLGPGALNLVNAAVAYSVGLPLMASLSPKLIYSY